MRTISKSFGLENSRSHVKVERKKCKSEWAGGGQYLLLAIKKMLVLLILFLISIRCKLGEKTIVPVSHNYCTTTFIAIAKG